MVIFHFNGYVGILSEVGNLQIQRPFDGARNSQPAGLRGSCRLREGLRANARDENPSLARTSLTRASPRSCCDLSSSSGHLFSRTARVVAPETFEFTSKDSPVQCIEQ